jgi:hypothetical protein
LQVDLAVAGTADFLTAGVRQDAPLERADGHALARAQVGHEDPDAQVR